MEIAPPPILSSQRRAIISHTTPKIVASSAAYSGECSGNVVVWIQNFRPMSKDWIQCSQNFAERFRTIIPVILACQQNWTQYVLLEAMSEYCCKQKFQENSLLQTKLQNSRKDMDIFWIFLCRLANKFHQHHNKGLYLLTLCFNFESFSSLL